MKYIAVFGSLKQGFYNHARFDLGEPFTTVGIRGAMYKLFTYPHLIREEVARKEHVQEHSAEIYEVSDELYQTLLGMELGAGYQEYKTQLEGDDGEMYPCTIFYTADDYDYSNLEYLDEYSQETVPEAWVADKLITQN